MVHLSHYEQGEQKKPDPGRRHPYTQQVKILRRFPVRFVKGFVNETP